MKGKKIHHLALAHIMHAPHKACNFRFTESKGRGEKSKQWRVNGREKNQSRDRRVNGEKSKLRVKGEICKEWSKVRVKGGRNMQRREGGWQMAKCDFRVRKHCIYTCFFLSAGWLNQFGSVQSVSDFRNRNRTKPEIVYDFLIS